MRSSSSLRYLIEKLKTSLSPKIDLQAVLYSSIVAQVLILTRFKSS